MRRKNLTTLFITLIISVVLPVALSSCGSVRTHWGIEGDYELPFGDDDYYRQKHKKHKKHKKHRHHDDDDIIYNHDDEVVVSV